MVGLKPDQMDNYVILGETRRLARSLSFSVARKGHDSDLTPCRTHHYFLDMCSSDHFFLNLNFFNFFYPSCAHRLVAKCAVYMPCRRCLRLLVILQEGLGSGWKSQFKLQVESQHSQRPSI